MSLLRFFFLVQVMMAISWSASAGAIALDPSFRFLSLGQHIEILEDVKGAWTIHDVSGEELSKKFYPSRFPIPNVGFTDSVYWARFTIKNQLWGVNRLFLEIDCPTLNYIELYLPNQTGGFLEKTTGDQLPFSSRDLRYRNFIFSLNIPHNTSQQVYLRFQSTAIVLPLTLWTPTALMEKIENEQTLLGIYLGIVLAMAVYNLFLFLSARERIYLYYVGHVFGFFFFQLALNGLSMQYLWPDNIWWANHNQLFFGCFCALFAQLFARSFLHTRQNLQKLDRLAVGFVIITAVTMFLSLFLYEAIIQFISALIIGAIVFWVLPTFISLKKKVPAAPLFLVAWSILLMIVAIHLLKIFSILPINLFTTWIDEIGSALELVLLSFALAYRINTLKKKEKIFTDQLRRKNVELNSKNLALEESERTLEKKVKERTFELNEKNKQLNSALAALRQSIKEMLQAKESAERANMVRSEFLSNINHELRTPLQGVLGFARLGKSRSLEMKRSKLKEYFELIFNSGNKLLNLINNLLDLSKLENSQNKYSFRQSDLSPIIQAVIKEFSALTAEKNIAVKLEQNVSALPVWIDDEKITQVIGNLLGNSLKFAPKDSQIQIVLDKSDENLLFSIQDHGIGIPENELDLIFEKFTQSSKTKTGAGGTGLGLSICRQVVKDHQGKIWAENAPGGGAAFKFTLPIIPRGKS